MARRAIPPVAILVAAGAGWGLTVPLLRVAAGAGHPPLALLLWQNLMMAGLAGLLLRLWRRPWPRLRGNAPALLAVSILGTVLPGYFTFLTAGELPASARAIIIAMVPIFALPIALGLGAERFEPRRLAGLLLGLGAIGLLVLPGATRGPLPPLYVLLATVAPLSYAVESNVLSARPADLEPLGLLFGASLLSAALTLPLAWAADALVAPAAFGPAEQALLAIVPINLAAYAAYVWLAARGGAVFAAQVGYVVTLAGVFWGMVLLGERPGPAIWLSLGLMMAGIALVRPRHEGVKDA
ncbi:DMT family transporter [Amaricoccus solimangrovi]|nr:DMT family transporter [Amaricoccus solimangrovi]